MLRKILLASVGLGGLCLALPAAAQNQVLPCYLSTAGGCIPVSAANPLPTSGGGGGGASSVTIQDGSVSSQKAAVSAAGAVKVDGSAVTQPVSLGSQGSVAAGTAGTASDLAGGVYNSSLPALTNGQQAALQLNSIGILQAAGPEQFGTVSASSAAVMTGMGSSGVIDTQGAPSVSLSVTANPGGSTIILETSNDNTFATGVSQVTLTPTSTPGSQVTGISSTSTSNNVYTANISMRYIRLRVSSFVSGTSTVAVAVRQGMLQPNWAGAAAGGPMFVTVSPAAASGVANVPSATSAAGSNLVLKASAGNLYSFQVTSGASSGYVMLINATSAPVDGAVTPLKCYTLPANSSMGDSWNTPLRFGTGIVVVFSTTGCFTKTASATAFISGEFQ